MLFDLEADPHEEHDRAEDHPELVTHALGVMAEWGADALGRSATGVDPLWTVLHKGGPWHARIDTAWYLERLRMTGRSAWADYFARRAGDEHRRGRTGLPQSVHSQLAALNAQVGRRAMSWLTLSLRIIRRSAVVNSLSSAT